jgi:hypothetical protein
MYFRHSFGVIPVKINWLFAVEGVAVLGASLPG